MLRAHMHGGLRKIVHAGILGWPAALAPLPAPLPAHPTGTPVLLVNAGFHIYGHIWAPQRTAYSVAWLLCSAGGHHMRPLLRSGLLGAPLRWVVIKRGFIALAPLV